MVGLLTDRNPSHQHVCVNDAPTQVFFILDWGDGHVVLHLWAQMHVIWRTEGVSLLLLSSDLI